MSEEIYFSAWFSARLHEKRMSAGEFAQRARISRAASYFYLDGSRVPNEMALAKIAVGLGIDRASMPQFIQRRSK